MKKLPINFLAIVAVGCILFFIGHLQASSTRFRPAKRTVPNELIVVAHHILDYGFDCHSNGTAREVCHAELTKEIKEHTK